MIKGFICGVFDLIHPGHILMFQEAKKNCDILTLAINSCNNISSEINPFKNKPIFNLEERRAILESIKYIDNIITYDSEIELSELLKTGGYNIRFIGDDYFNKLITGKELDLTIYYIDRSHGYSTSNIIKKIRNV
jgi:glycerol-3-phosphate cytidylyltransferase